jgi:hypothetical protein
MVGRVSMATRSELVGAIIERYRSCSRSNKRQLLDEVVAVTGYHRKHAIRVLSRRETKPPRNRRQAIRYGADVRQALVVLWEASDRLCSKRLRPLIRCRYQCSSGMAGSTSAPSYATSCSRSARRRWTG